MIGLSHSLSKPQMMPLVAGGADIQWLTMVHQ